MDHLNLDDENIIAVPLEMASHSPKSQRSVSMTSRFYEAESEDQQVKSFIQNTSANVKSSNSDSKIRQSRHLPYWAWYLIAKCHGIPLRRSSKPILGTILHGLTFAGALTYALSYTWFVVYDILSPNTPRDIPGGCISMLLVYFWCGFGYYCKDLSSRLFLHPRFLKDIRMHTRTVFKMNGALVVFILGLFFTSANVLECLGWFSDPYCDKIELECIVCQVMSISSVFFSVFTLIWHSLVSFIFMSVCRTHTIGIRRFIKEIEYDASLIEQHLSFSGHLLPLSQDDIWQEMILTNKSRKFLNCFDSVHPVGVVPDHVIMNALAYQADPSSVDFRKVGSPNRFRRMSLMTLPSQEASSLLSEKVAPIPEGSTQSSTTTESSTPESEKKSATSRFSKSTRIKLYRRSKTLAES
ncbi:uncharacterized protein NPIL_20592 [Nephila pilipes]|uniref:Uncharacterized protein n=1 Tax=Nephila pilipes TaxID=299642 RepID=A0A8X6UFG0_NEPPI|nr:uncharacterized protein NPIL_20592 [Nephila pilipes]